MPITKDKKIEIVKNLEKYLADSKSVVFVNFHGLTVGDASALRRSLRKEGVGYTVAKKSLIKRALDTSAIKGDMPEMLGELSLAFGSDLVAPARGIYEFQKKLLGKVSIMGGVFEGVYKSKSEMMEIALIPSLQVLRGMFVNIINSPIQRMVIALNQIAEKK